MVLRVVGGLGSALPAIAVGTIFREETRDCDIWVLMAKGEPELAVELSSLLMRLLQLFVLELLSQVFSAKTRSLRGNSNEFTWPILRDRPFILLLLLPLLMLICGLVLVIVLVPFDSETLKVEISCSL